MRLTDAEIRAQIKRDCLVTSEDGATYRAVESVDSKIARECLRLRKALRKIITYNHGYEWCEAAANVAKQALGHKVERSSHERE